MVSLRFQYDLGPPSLSRTASTQDVASTLFNVPMKRRCLLVGCFTLTSVAGCVGEIEEFIGENEASEDVFGVGEIDVYIDGEPVDLSADRFQAEYADDYAVEFHMHEFDDQWYMEGNRPVTVAESLDKLPEFSYHGTEDGAVLEIDDETYDAREPNVIIEVRINDEVVEPDEYVLEDGDKIVVEVETG